MPCCWPQTLAIQNKPQLNTDKTETISAKPSIFADLPFSLKKKKKKNKKKQQQQNTKQNDIQSSDSARNLGVIVDRKLSMKN